MLAAVVAATTSFLSSMSWWMLGQLAALLGTCL
jgi:hypothetical protein